ncbi:MAG: aldose epimerase family protein, partial [Rikenellaceae bacterium]
IDTVKYSLSDNNKGNCIHGGQNGLDRVVWSVDSVSTNKICFSYVSPDGDQGFPGELKINMTYTLTDDNQFVINYAATTTKTTFVNFSHHSFFNLKGEGNGTILDHIVTINSDSITLVDSNMIPSGVIASVESTPFDFSKPTAIGDRINADDEQLKFVSGYDHNWVLDCTKGVVHAATVYEPSTGRCMEVWTDQPGMQFYTSNSLHGANKGKSGKGYNFRESFAMETQKYPDSPHHSNFPSALLNPDQTYIQTCIYKFSVQK